MLPFAPLALLQSLLDQKHPNDAVRGGLVRTGRSLPEVLLQTVSKASILAEPGSANTSHDLDLGLSAG
tara:strand:+ start:305 stop:508 length:204 start_codon:yes stop_codon:yes gene_type:complete